MGPQPDGVYINRCTTVPVGELGEPRQRSLECGTCWNTVPSSLWPALSAPLSSQSLSLLPLRVPPHSHSPFSILHNHQAPLTLGLCSLCPGLGKLCLQLLCTTVFTSCRSWSGVPPWPGCPSPTPAALEQPFISTRSRRASPLQLFCTHLLQGTSQTFYLRIYLAVCYLFSLERALSFLATAVTQGLDQCLMYSVNTYGLNGPRC